MCSQTACSLFFTWNSAGVMRLGTLAYRGMGRDMGTSIIMHVSPHSLLDHTTLLCSRWLNTCSSDPKKNDWLPAIECVACEQAHLFGQGIAGKGAGWPVLGSLSPLTVIPYPNKWACSQAIECAHTCIFCLRYSFILYSFGALRFQSAI